jgi:hypothetical protein
MHASKSHPVQLAQIVQASSQNSVVEEELEQPVNVRKEMAQRNVMIAFK